MKVGRWVKIHMGIVTGTFLGLRQRVFSQAQSALVTNVILRINLN